MSEQNINNESYDEIPTNDINISSKDSSLIGGSSVAETINAAGGVDPSRFWVVFMIALIIALASTVTLGGGYLVNQLNKKDVEISALRVKLEECPQKALYDLQKQQRAIEEIKQNVINNSNRIQEIKYERLKDVKNLEQMDKKLKSVNQ